MDPDGINGIMQIPREVLMYFAPEMAGDPRFDRRAGAGIRFRKPVNINVEKRAKGNILAEAEKAVYADDDAQPAEPLLACCSAGPEDTEESVDLLLAELAQANEEQLRRLGLSEASLRFILKLGAKPSRMRITRSAKIILEDYGRREIHLDPKTKALYLLFLRHPEGLAIKDLPDYFDELLDLYQSVSGRDDKDAMRLTIESLTDPFGNDANISLSRIKRAFGESFCQQIARNYFVTGERGGLRTISLDRALVTWETIR